MTAYSPQRKTFYRSDLFHPSQMLSLGDVESAVWELQGVIRPDTLPHVVQDVLEEENDNALLLLLSSLEGQQQTWFMDSFPKDTPEFPESAHHQILTKLSRSYLLSNAVSAVQQRIIPVFVDMIKALDEMEFIELGPIDDDKKPKTQRQMKMRRRAATKSRVIDTELFKLFDIEVPENRAEADETKILILTQQKSILQRYLEALRSETLVDAIMESCVTKQEVHVTPVPTMQPVIANESIDASESSNAMVYPKVQPMKSALYFDNPEGFGDWFIFIGPAADSELRRRHKKERTTFDIIVKKMKELSNGHFSPDNHKRLGKSGAKSAVYEAKMTSDLRLVYQIDLVPSNDERLRQAIKIFGIFTHAQMENNRLWESVNHQLGRKNKQYREYCAVRQRIAGSDNHTFTPAYFPPLPEGLEDMQVSNLLADDADQLQSRFLMEKYVQFSQPLMNTMLADLNAVFPHLVSPQEKLVIEHLNSCYVIGRSGTGKTTTLLFKMLLVERTYKLSEPGKPRPRQIFVTQSPILAKKVSQYFAMLDQSLVAADGDRDRLAKLPNASTTADDDMNMISAEDMEDWWNHLPQQFSQLEDSHFPLFLTWNKLSTMLEADMVLQQKKTKGTTTNERASVHMTRFRPNDLVDFRKFVRHYWPAISQSLAKKTDPALAFGEVIGVIKGSEAALSKETRFLDCAAYESVCNRRPVFFASDTDCFYSVFQAYINRKKQRGDRDIADRAHDILDFFRQSGVPGQKVDHLYVDEVQDNLLIDTLILRAICLNPNGLFWAGDTAQGISAGSAFRFNELKALQWRLENEKVTAIGKGPHSMSKPEIFQLAVNYRSHSGIVNCAHSVIELINHFWSGSIDQLAPEIGMIEGPRPIFFSDPGNDKSILEQYLFGSSGNPVEFGAQQCILVRDDEARTRLRQAIGDEVGLIMTIHDSKGLEFNDVLIYNFFTDSNVDAARWRVILNAVDDLTTPAPVLDNHKHANIWLELKFLYVALTRARDNVWLADSSIASEPMKLYWTSRSLIRTMAPGVKAPRLATSSSPEEWLCQGRTLFDQRQFLQAKHCFEKARRWNYAAVAEAYIIRDEAEGKSNERDRRSTFKDAAKAFKTCAVLFDRRRSDFLRLSANCSRKAKDFLSAAQAYAQGGMHDDAAECYLEIRMYDEAVDIVRAGNVNNPTLAESVVRIAKVFYFTEVQSLPASDPQRALRLKQGTTLFDSPEEALEYAEDRSLDVARSDILITHSRFTEAADLHLAEGRLLEAISLLVRQGGRESTHRAGQYVLDGLWRRISFAVRRENIRDDPEIPKLLKLGTGLVMDDCYRKELTMFTTIFHGGSVTDLRELGQSFLLDHNFAAAFLCLEQYFDGFALLQNQDVPLPVVVGELELFLQYTTILTSELKASSLESSVELSKLFGFQNTASDQISLVTGSFLFNKLENVTPEEEVIISSLKLTNLLRSSVEAHLRSQLEKENEICRTLKAFTLCLPFAVAGICNRSNCPKAHIGGHDLTTTSYTMRVRIHLQQVLLLRQIPFDASKDSYSQRRYWLRRLYEALFPPHPNMGNMASLEAAKIPELQEKIVDDIRSWILGFVFSHRLLPLPTFLTLLSYGATLLITAVPSLSTLQNSGTLSTCSSDSRYLYRGQWKWSVCPWEYRREGGNAVYDLLSMMEGTAPNSLNRGILCLCHIIKKKLAIDISMLCHLIEDLCRNLILSAACYYDGEKIHNVMLPRSWLSLGIDAELLRTRNFNFVMMLVGPIMVELLTQIHTGVDADHLQYETVTLGSPLYNRNIIRSVFINRICRSLALFGYNFRNNQVRQAIFYTLTSLRYCNPPPPPSAPWTWYAYAEDWNAIARLARNSIRATSMDEMIHLLHTSKLCGTPPNFPSVRYIVYTRLDELPTLLRAEKPAPPKPVTLPASVDNEADIVEPAENRAEDHLIDDAAPAVPTDSADDNPHVMSAEEKEQEERILARIPEIYRKNHARTQAARTRTEERRDDYFLSCREAARSCNLPGGVYLKMMLGPLPHVLMTLQALYDLTQEFKRKTKDWMKGELSHEQLDMLDQQLTQTNSAIKSITALQKNLGSKSPIHSEQRDSLLKKYVGETRVLIAEGLPFALPEDVHREFNIGWKGIVKPKAPKKPAKSEERPTLNTSDLDELDFE